MNGRWGQALVLPGGLSQSYLKASWMVAHNGIRLSSSRHPPPFSDERLSWQCQATPQYDALDGFDNSPIFDRGAGRVSRPALPLFLLPVAAPHVD
jgi:hypothetical protein